jgi:hypothetical protein
LIDAVFHPDRSKRSLEARRRKRKGRGIPVRMFNTPSGVALRLHPSEKQADVDAPEPIAGSFRLLP